ncbi:hypothetical protein EYF80_011191 [Liparis tanakae]|uniref:Uncharacterized protein n=1 Tax=Liparis tanakae TaxID=230148 RepID=A0A4Z2IL14_9TELE|nr:hypothetical protein EYF80_011191 [Liparis tanakae]
MPLRCSPYAAARMRPPTSDGSVPEAARRPRTAGTSNRKAICSLCRPPLSQLMMNEKNLAELERETRPLGKSG